MSGWDAYTQNLIAQGQTSGAAIVGFPDGGLWAQTSVALQGTEGKDICDRFSNPFNGQGIVVGGVKYMATACNDQQLTGKKGPTGVCITKSGRAVIISVYGEGQNAGDCLNHNYKMSDDLTSKGF